MCEIKSIIIDDEELGRKIIREFLAVHPEVKVLAECQDAHQALEAIQKYHPDLLFLDVQMPEINGFELLEMLETIPSVIFSTAYDRYALKAFEVNAIDYLLKPFDQERFDKALSRAKEAMRSPQFEEKKIRNLVRQLRSDTKYRDKFMIKYTEKILVLGTDEIDWIEAQGDYVNIHTGKKTYLILKSLQSLEKELDPHRFIRVHRSSIVNLNAIKEIVPWTGGRHLMNLKDGSQITISRSGSARLKKFMI